MIPWVDSYLNEWSRWLERAEASRLGYPSQSTTYRMMRERGRLTKKPKKGAVVARRYLREFEGLDGKKRKEVVRHMIPIEPPKQTQDWSRWDADILWPRHIEEIDLCVRRLDEREQELLRVHYIEAGTGRQKAQRLGMGKSLYYDTLGAIHQRIAAEYEDS